MNLGHKGGAVKLLIDRLNQVAGDNEDNDDNVVNTLQLCIVLHII